MAKILVVDDMTGIRRSLSVILSGAGYDVCEAENGAKAIDIIKKDTGVDLVITDILMPESDGLALMSYIKSSNDGPKLIAISGGGSKADAHSTLESARKYANCVIEKPFQREQLLHCTEHVLKGITCPDSIENCNAGS